MIEKKRCWVIVPAYNEGRRIENVVKEIRKEGYFVCVVDDGSKDKTSEIAERAGAVSLKHIVNLGKGAAMKTGATYALRQKAQAIIFLDGDGQHHPGELPLFYDALNKGNDIVFGARRVKGTMPLERRLGRWAIHTIIKLFYNFDLHDPLSGYRAMTTRGYKKIMWQSRGYGVETEMIARAGNAVLEYTEVDISTIYHERHKGMTVIDGLKIIINLVWWRMTH